MATPWEDKVKNRNPKQLTIFVAPTLNKPWRRAFDDALNTFNQLSQDNRLGVTMVAPDNATRPDPNGAGGADVQFDMGKGDIAFSALGQDFQIRNFSGTAMHGKTELLRGPVGSQAQRIQKAFVFVPQTPMVVAQMAAGRGKFKDVQREVGHGIKHFIAAHELIHVQQYERWGVLFFPLYVTSSLVEFLCGADPYRDNAFEREAYAKTSTRTEALPMRAGQRE